MGGLSHAGADLAGHVSMERRGGAELAHAWHRGGGHGGVPRRCRTGRRSGPKEPANSGTATGGKVPGRKRRRQGAFLLDAGGRGLTEATGGEERAAAVSGSWRRCRSGAAPAKARRSPGSREGGEANGGGGEDVAAVVEALGAVERVAAGGEKNSNSGELGGGREIGRAHV